jgi:hypothetical protein
VTLHRRLGALTVVLAAASCGRASAGRPAEPTLPPVLSASAVPGVPSTTTRLTVAELAKDASIPGLAARLRAFGFEVGRERTFQGESRHLTHVVSRALAFRTADGAAGFVEFVRANARAYFGSGVSVRPLAVGPWRGWLFSPAACACHLANPDYVDVVQDGRSLVWLDINGPDATPELLRTLLAHVTSA